MGKRHSSAALVLMREGVTLRSVGARLGVSQAAITRYLQGDVRPHRDLIPAIRLVAGPAVAHEIAGLLNLEVVK